MMRHLSGLLGRVLGNQVLGTCGWIVFAFSLPSEMTRARRSTAVISIRKIFVDLSRICSELSGSSGLSTMRQAYMQTVIEYCPFGHTSYFCFLRTGRWESVILAAIRLLITVTTL